MIPFCVYRTLQESISLILLLQMRESASFHPREMIEGQAHLSRRQLDHSRLLQKASLNQGDEEKKGCTGNIHCILHRPHTYTHLWPLSHTCLYITTTEPLSLPLPTHTYLWSIPHMCLYITTTETVHSIPTSPHTHTHLWSPFHMNL